MIQIQNKIMAFVNAGQLQSARTECLNLCQQHPDDAQLWFMLSAICGQMQDFSAAEQYCRKSLELNDSIPSIYYNLAVALRGQGKTNDAFISLEKAVQLQPDFTAALYELGNICLERQDYVTTVDYYQKVIDLSSDAFQAYSGMAIAQQKLGNIESALSACIESLRISPQQQDVTLRLAGLYDGQNNTDNAIQYYNRAIELGYRKADVYINIGRMYGLCNTQSEAENYYKKALIIDPEAVEALTNLALLYEETHNASTALSLIEKAYQLDSNNEIITYNYAKILATVCRYTEAASLYKKVLNENPDFVEAVVNLGNLYLLSGKPDIAQEVYSHACNIKPSYYDACSNWLMSLNYTNRYSDAEIRDKHFAWAMRIEKDIKPLPNIPSKNNKSAILKVGYVSPDFRAHSVACFIEGLLKYSNKQNVINYCYSDVKNRDEVTQRLEASADKWRDVTMIDDEALANLIQRDGIDILIDLCGHTSGNRLLMFALKPAAKQITYLGYPNTTGLTSVDYRIVDNTTDPSGSEDMMSESPVYMTPCFLGYTPYEDSPGISESPAVKNTYVTFGSFNNLAKMTDDVIAIWSKILLEVPDSKLCIKAKQYTDTEIKKDHIKRFNNAGIDESRLELLSYSNTTTEHLQRYNRIDIALDTFPYNGTTTTFEALWMGVPVVCLNGTCHAGRVGASILKTLGKTELLAENPQQYIKIATNLANDVNKLKQLHSQLRHEMSISSLLDSKTFTQKFESVLLDVIDKDV